MNTGVLTQGHSFKILPLQSIPDDGCDVVTCSLVIRFHHFATNLHIYPVIDDLYLHLVEEMN